MILAGSRISVVSSICVPHDAISYSVAETARILDSVCPGDVRVFSFRNDVDGIPGRTVSGVGDLLTDSHWLSSDILIFHYGIHYDLFDALICGNGRALRLARFHNVTPRELVPAHATPTIDRSLEQMVNLRWADHVWCDSDFNRAALVDMGLPTERLSTLSLPVVVPDAAPVAVRSDEQSPVTLLYIGRLVRSKGVHDLVRAAIELRDSGIDGFRIMLAGSRDFSDDEFTASLERLVAEAGAHECVTFCGEVSETEKARLMEAAHALVIPSYHEGFCMPVVEALGRGCFIIGYAAGNTPAVTAGFGSLVLPGDVLSLRGAMESFVKSIRKDVDPVVVTDGHGCMRLSEFRRQAHAYATNFSPSRFRERLLQSLDAIIGRRAQ